MMLYKSLSIATGNVSSGPEESCTVVRINCLTYKV